MQAELCDESGALIAVYPNPSARVTADFHLLWLQ